MTSLFESEPDAIVPVLSVLIYQDVSRSHVLLGVRRPSPTSGRHPSVLSTPTMRLPAPVMSQIIAELGIESVDVETPYFKYLADRPWTPIGVPLSLRSTISFVTEALICRKLSLADELVDGKLAGAVRPVALALDTIHDDVGGFEHTFMLTVECELLTPLFDISTGNSSYSRLSWVDATRIDEAVRSRDPLILLSDASVLEVCIHGLCVRSAAFALGRFTPGGD